MTTWKRPKLDWPGKQALEAVLEKPETEGGPAADAGIRVRQSYRMDDRAGDKAPFRGAGPGPDPDNRGRLILGDNRKILEALLRTHAGRFDLVYLDPPYGTGKRRQATGSRKGLSDDGSVLGFQDRRADDPGYLSDLYTVLHRSASLLHPKKGQIFVHVDHRASHFVRMIMDEIFGTSAFRNEIVWHYKSGGRARNTYARKFDMILWYARSSGFTFHPERIGRPRSFCPRCLRPLAKRNNMKRCEDQDGRVFRTIRSGGRIYKYYDDEPSPPSNVWMDIPHIHQKDPERTGFPTQKPEALLHRIILAHTEPGDLVGDFYCGSGTTLLTARNLERRWLGCDLSPLAIHLTRQRLLAASMLTPMLAPSKDICGSFTIESVNGLEPAWPTKEMGILPALSVQKAEDGRELVAVSLHPEQDRNMGLLDYWGVQWQPGTDGCFTPDWWSVRSKNGPVAAESPRVPVEKAGRGRDDRMVNVLLADRKGAHQLATLKMAPS